MEAISSSETSVETQRTTRRHVPEDDTLHIFVLLTILLYCYVDGWNSHFFGI
jgi:hypothetical protein